MRGFYKKLKSIDCKDCKIQITRLTPNHKRCVACAYKIALKRARESARKLLPEENRRRFNEWYQLNKDRERKVRLARWHNRKII